MSHKFIYNGDENPPENLSIDGDVIDDIIDKDLSTDVSPKSPGDAFDRLVEFVKKHVRSPRTIQEVRRENAINKYSHGLGKVEDDEKKGIQLKKIA